MTATDADALKAAAIAAMPDLAGERFTLLGEGWDSVALSAGGLVLKFPRHAEAEARLRAEARLLEAVRPRVSLPVPEMTLHDGPQVFSSHPRIEGGHLTPEVWAALDEPARARLAEDLGRFHAELHAIPHPVMQAVGAEPVERFQPPERILEKAVPALPPALRPRAEAAVRAWARMEPDPLGEVYGFFDGHGWNMAFDAARGRLNGIYDFGDSGFGPRHEDFFRAGFIDFILPGRVAGVYERLTGLAPGRERIALLAGIHRLSELAACAGEPAHVPMLTALAAAWLERD